MNDEEKEIIKLCRTTLLSRIGQKLPRSFAGEGSKQIQYGNFPSYVFVWRSGQYRIYCKHAFGGHHVHSDKLIDLIQEVCLNAKPS